MESEIFIKTEFTKILKWYNHLTFHDIKSLVEKYNIGRFVDDKEAWDGYRINMKDEEIVELFKKVFTS